MIILNLVLDGKSVHFTIYAEKVPRKQVICAKRYQNTHPRPINLSRVRGDFFYMKDTSTKFILKVRKC
jgi:hypothetical protein